MSKLQYLPFFSVRSVETAVRCDICSLSIVGVEKQENVGIQTGVGHNRNTNECFKYCTECFGAPE